MYFFECVNYYYLLFLSIELIHDFDKQLSYVQSAVNKGYVTRSKIMKSLSIFELAIHWHTHWVLM